MGFLGLSHGVFRNLDGIKLVKYLESLGPIFIKFGQLLSTRTDILDESMAKELQSLTDDCIPFDVSLYKQIVESELGDSIENLFDDFDEVPLAAASLAQVHSAKLKDGQEIVIKTLRPGIEKKVKRNLRLMKAAAKFLTYTYSESKRLRPLEVVRDYEKTILRELDLKLEAANTNLTRKNFFQAEELYIPEVFWDMTTSKVMVLEKIDGIPCTDIEQIEKYGINKERLAENGGVVQINFASYFIDQDSKDTKAPIDADVAKYISDNNLDPNDYESYDEYRKEQYDKRFLYVGTERVVDHIDHVVNLVGIDHVGFGSDFDGVGYTLPADLKGPEGFPIVIYHLLKQSNWLKKRGQDYIFFMFQQLKKPNFLETTFL